jgi:cytoskeletal protein RodZ
MNSGSDGDDTKKGRASDGETPSERDRDQRLSDTQPIPSDALMAEGTAGEAVAAGEPSPDDPWAARPETATPETLAGEPVDTPAAVPDEARGQPRKSGGGGWLWLLVAVGVIGAAGYFTRDMWYDQVVGSPTTADRSATNEPAKIDTAKTPASGKSTDAPAGGDAATAPSAGEAAQTPKASQAPMVSATTAVPAVPPATDAATSPSEGDTTKTPSSGGMAREAGAADTAAIDERMTEIADQLATIEARIGDLEARLGASTGTDDEVASLQQRLDRLEAGVQPIAPLETRLSALEVAERQTHPQVGRETALVLAVGQVRQALSSSGAYGDQLDALRTVVADDAELEALVESLQQHANDGVPTEDALRTRFPAMARDVIRAEQGISGDGWVARMTNRLTSLVTVRRTGEAAVAAGGSDAVLAEAQAALDAGDLGGAVAAVGHLQGPAAAAARPWLDDATARLDVEAALASLQSTALARLATARG